MCTSCGKVGRMRLGVMKRSGDESAPRAEALRASWGAPHRAVLPPVELAAAAPERAQGPGPAPCLGRVIARVGSASDMACASRLPSFLH